MHRSAAAAASASGHGDSASSPAVHDPGATRRAVSTAARTLSLAKVLRMSDDEAFDTFKAIVLAHWATNPLKTSVGV